MYLDYQLQKIIKELIFDQFKNKSYDNNLRGNKLNINPNNSIKNNLIYPY